MKLRKFELYKLSLVLCFLSLSLFINSQSRRWLADGNTFLSVKDNNIIKLSLPSMSETVIVKSDDLIPKGKDRALKISDFDFSLDSTKILVFTNTKKVWRYDTKGDYWVYDRTTKQLKQIGKNRPESSLMFAKFSPDGSNVAYVSHNNLYVEDLKTGVIKALTSNQGKSKLIHGTFDWAYEEEFDCRDGFSWSPDGKKIAYWQIDATKIRDFLMINTTDSIYAYNIHVEYPKVGELPSACRVGVIDPKTGKNIWMNVPGDPRAYYIPRMMWAKNNQELILQQLNRRQNHSKIFLANAATGSTRIIDEEKEDTWVDVRSSWPSDQPWHWLSNNKEYLWISEKDGWNAIYKVNKETKQQQLLTPGNYDVINPLQVDEKAGYLYFIASPTSPNERYLYRVNMNDTNKDPQRLTPNNQEGWHSYDVSPNGKWAYHTFSNYYTAPISEWIDLSDHTAINSDASVAKKFDPSKKELSNISFFKVTIEDNVTLDAWMAKPKNFDPTKKYPVLFYVYSEPAAQTVTNRWGTGQYRQYVGDFAGDGYIYISVENRGTPAPRGKDWRKSIYRNIGILNIKDQAMACKKLLETYSYLDKDRIAVHGWSGGGSATCNLLFQYPELYQTGIAGAAVANQLTYDNIYQERYMGLIHEGDKEFFVKGSPVTHAKNLKGNLLYIHGTGDDNVHYQNAEMLINELVKHQKQFQMMAYPNRDHGLHPDNGARTHMNQMITNFLKTHCPPGAR